MAYDYDAVVIGTGAGGGTAAWVLARAGWRVLMIERGPLCTDQTAWHDERRMIIQKEPFDDRIIWVNGREQRLYNGGIAGGGTALYGAALLRPSRDDFTPGRHYACLLPRHLWEWPIPYEALAMYYDQAEDLYHVAADGGQPMPHLAERRTAYPRTPPALEPINLRLANAMRAHGFQPFHLPLAIDFDHCLRCPTCPGYVCPNGSRASSLNRCVQPAVSDYGAELWTNTDALVLSHRGSKVTSVRVRRRATGRLEEATARLYVLAAGTVGTPVLLLTSGLVGRSGQVGRNYMYHAGAAVAGVFGAPTGGAIRFVKQLGFTDLYLGARGFPHKLGYVQALPLPGPLSMQRQVSMPIPVASWLYRRTVLLSGAVEDLPLATNRVEVGRQGQIIIRHTYHPYDRYRSRYMLAQLKPVLRRAGAWLVMGATSEWDTSRTSHQVGTCRFGTDPTTSALDAQCRLHGYDNVYTVDGSFMPTSLGVGPALTIMANALRVAAHLIEEGT